MDFSAGSPGIRAGFDRRARRLAGGFTLTELLIVIAVIGIMAAVAVPMISPIHRNAHAAKDRKNAQQIAQLFWSAQAAGAPLNTTSKDSIVADLTAGVTGTVASGNMSFHLSPLAADEKAGAYNYLTLDGGVLSYSPPGTP